MISPITAARWYCILVGAFLLVRALSTLAGHPTFETPGDGWRALLQLVVVAVLAVGAIRPREAIPAVAAVGVLYALETILGRIGNDAILGLIPVDMRDRIVHPTLAVLALVIVLMRGCQLRAARTPSRA